MKKITFAFQVFALLSAFPLYVFMELNHTTLQRTENSIVTKASKNVKEIAGVQPKTQVYKVKI